MKMRSFILSGALFCGLTASAMGIKHPIARLEIHGPVVAHPVSHFITIFDNGVVKRDNVRIGHIAAEPMEQLITSINAIDPQDVLEDVDAGKPATVGDGARNYVVFQGPSEALPVGNVVRSHRFFLKNQMRFSKHIFEILNGFAALSSK